MRDRDKEKRHDRVFQWADRCVQLRPKWQLRRLRAGRHPRRKRPVKSLRQVSRFLYARRASDIFTHLRAHQDEEEGRRDFSRRNIFTALLPRTAVHICRSTHARARNEAKSDDSAAFKVATVVVVVARRRGADSGNRMFSF